MPNIHTSILSNICFLSEIYGYRNPLRISVFPCLVDQENTTTGHPWHQEGSAVEGGTGLPSTRNGSAEARPQLTDALGRWKSPRIIHGAGIFTYTWAIGISVGGYTIHGAYGHTTTSRETCLGRRCRRCFEQQCINTSVCVIVRVTENVVFVVSPRYLNQQRIK